MQAGLFFFEFHILYVQRTKFAICVCRGKKKQWEWDLRDNRIFPKLDLSHCLRFNVKLYFGSGSHLLELFFKTLIQIYHFKSAVIQISLENLIIVWQNIRHLAGGEVVPFFIKKYVQDFPLL